MFAQLYKMTLINYSLVQACISKGKLHNRLREFFLIVPKILLTIASPGMERRMTDHRPRMQVSISKAVPR